MKKNETYTAEIEDLTLEGNGVCHVEGMVVFVPHTAIGDHILLKIVKVCKRYAYGIALSVETYSPDRETPLCTLKRCGGCIWSHLTYEAELAVKEKAARDAFCRIGKLSPEFLPILPAPSRTRYRNKAQYPFSVTREGKPILGFYAPRSHDCVSVDDCLLQPEIFGEICSIVLQYVESLHLSVYDETTGKGDLRHLYLRMGAHSGEIMVCFVTRRPIGDPLHPLVRALIAQVPAIQSIVMNINPHNTNVILGKQTFTLWGRDTIRDTICGIPVELAPAAFYQVNTLQAEHLYALAAEFAELTGKETLLDLYCGAGTIGLSMAHHVARLLGVEVVPEAVRNAKENARRAKITHAEFYCGDAGTYAAQFAEEGIHPDVIVVDPPRKGCTTQALIAMASMHPERMVMISCNPATAARDCAALAEQGYIATKAQPVDMFPYTGHVEMVIQLCRGKVDDSVQI